MNKIVFEKNDYCVISRIAPTEKVENVLIFAHSSVQFVWQNDSDETKNENMDEKENRS